MRSLPLLIAIAALGCAGAAGIGPADAAPGRRAGLGQGPPEDRHGDEDGAGAGVPDSDRGRQAADDQVQAAAGLQGRDLGLGRARRARACARAPRATSSSARCSSATRSTRFPRRASARPKVIIDKMPIGHRHRVPQGQPVLRDEHEDRALRQHRGQARQPRRAEGAVRQAARRQRPQLEVPAHPRRQALLRHRRAVQHLRSGRVREDLPHEPRRQRHRDDRLRRAQHGRLRLRSEDRRPLVHRQRPRLVQRGAAERRAERRHQARASSTSAIRSATRATSPTRNSAGASRATTTPSRPRCSGRTPARWA